jgi:hypothetical protein
MSVEHVHFGLPRESSRMRGCLRSLGLPSLIAGIAASAVTFAPYPEERLLFRPILGR